MDIWLPFALTVILEILKMIIKNPEKKELYKSRMKKVYKSIQAAYPEFDEE